MRYAIARYKERSLELAYRVYVTDCLRTLTENTAKFAGGSYITARFFDSIPKNKRDDGRTGEEIAVEVIKRAGLVIKE